MTRSVGAREILFHKNDPADALYAVRRGGIRIVTGTAEGRQLTLNMLGSGDVFGEVALLDGCPRTADRTDHGADDAGDDELAETGCIGALSRPL